MRARVAACGRISFTATSVCRHLARHTVPSAPLPISSSSLRSDLEHTANKGSKEVYDICKCGELVQPQRYAPVQEHVDQGHP